MKRLLLLILPFLLVLSCIEYEEEMWVNKDGSGKIKMKISMPQFLAEYDTEGEGISSFDEENVKKKIEEIDGLTLIESKSYEENEKNVIEMVVKFDSFEILEKANEEEDNQLFIGDIKMEKDEDDRIVFKRTISMEDSSKSEADKESEKLMAAMLGQYKFSYMVHFPNKVIEANTSDDNIDQKSNTVKWTFSLASIISAPQEMVATLEAAEEAKDQFNWLTVGIGVVVVFMLISIISMAVKKRKK